MPALGHAARRVCGETLTAGGAAVGPLARVPRPVLHQLPLHVEGLAALVAGEHLLGRVRLLVLLQVTEVTEPCGGQTGVRPERYGHSRRYRSGAKGKQLYLGRRCHTSVASPPSG